MPYIYLHIYEAKKLVSLWKLINKKCIIFISQIVLTNIHILVNLLRQMYSTTFYKFKYKHFIVVVALFLTYIKKTKP